MTIKIGMNAGAVWNALTDGGKTLKELKKVTKLTEKELYAALGWLAREAKVKIEETDKEVYVELA